MGTQFSGKLSNTGDLSSKERIRTCSYTEAKRAKKTGKQRLITTAR
jgi:hypothetical protein